MLVSTDPVLVLGYGVWEMENGPATRSDGSTVERVDFYDPEQGEAWQVSLAEGIGKDERPAPGSQAILELRIEKTQKVGKDGIVRPKQRYTVMGFRTPNGRASDRSAREAAKASA